MMRTRHWVGDLSLAVLMALPTAVLAKAQVPAAKLNASAAPALHAGATATPPAVRGRISLLG